MSDTYIHDVLIEEDLDLDDDSRLHLNGLDIEMQTKIASVWTTHQTWTGSYDGVWRLHAELGKVMLQERNANQWVTSYSWG